MFIRLLCTFAVLSLVSLPARAQTVDISILIDDPGMPGCDIAPAGLPVIPGIDARLTATIDQLAAQVVSVSLAQCSGAAFGTPASLGGGQPAGDNNGLSSADVVEFSVQRAAVTDGTYGILVAALAENGNGADATGLRTFGTPVTAVPGLGATGLLVLALLLVALAWVALRRQRALLAVMLFGIAFTAWAMSFMVDGQVGDWSGIPELTIDPAGDATNNEDAVDILALFVGQDSPNGDAELFFRVDMADLIINNLPPVAQDDLLATDEDNTVSGDLFANNGNGADTDPDLDPFAVTMVAGTASVGVAVALPSGAQVTVNADGTFTYNPLTAFNSLSQGETANDSFTYTIDDAVAGADQGSATVTISGVNDLATAVDDSFNIDEDTGLNSAQPGVLGNDTDPDGNDILTAVLDTAPANATSFTLNADGSFSYQPLVNFNGSDSFTYHANDGLADSNTATVTINVSAVNDPPQAQDDNLATDEDGPTSGNLFADNGNGIDADPESDPFTITMVAGTATVGAAVILPSGAQITADADGAYTYDPLIAFNSLSQGQTATDSFTYTIDDGIAGADQGTVTVTITGVNDLGTAMDDSYATAEDTPLSQLAPGVLSNDTDPDASDALTAILDSPPGNAMSFALSADGSFSYTPVLNFNGMDSFTYHANDGLADTNTATVMINVGAVNDAPVAADDTGDASDEDTAITTANVLSNDMDADMDLLSVAANDALSALSAAITDLGNGTFTYDPTVSATLNALAAGQMATDTFSYTVTDGLLSDVATVTVTITGVNDPITAVDDAGAGFATDEDTGFNTANVLANDSDPDTTDVLSVQSVDAASAQGATISDNFDGTFSYDPGAAASLQALAAGAMLTDTFSYTAQDNNGSIDTAVVSIVVTGINDAPVIAFPTGGTVFNNLGAVNLDLVATLSDVDSTDLDTGDLTVSLALSADPALCDVNDILTIENQGMGAGQIGFDGTNISFEATQLGTVASGYLCTDLGGGLFDISPLLIDFDANADLPAVTALLQALQYNTASADDQDRQASAMVTDGDGGSSNAALTTITVNLNQAPVITSDGGGATAAVNAAENQTAVTTVTATDADVPAQTLTFSLSGGADQALFSITAGGVLTFNAAPDFEVAGDAGADGVYDVQVTVTDDGTPILSDVQDIAVTVTDINEAPVITSDGGGATAAVNAAENQTAVTTVTATDADVPVQTLTFSLSGGADQALFSITAGGVLTFNAAPDFEVAGDAGADGVYDVQVTVTDDGTPILSDVQDIAVTVTDINEAPVITSDGGGATAAVNAAENQTAVTTVTATDADVPAQTLTFSLSGGADQALFSITAGGVLTFNTAPDFEVAGDAGADGVYDVQVTVTDNGAPNLSDVQDIAVTVTDINEAPVITSDGGGATAAVNAAENQTAVTTVTATDEDLPAQTLTFSISGGADQALFGITAGGVLTFNTAPDFEVAGDAGANGVYDVQVTVTDNGAPNLSDVQDIAVTVTDVNDSPVITSNGGGATAAVSAAENQTAVTTVTATDVDMPAQTLTFSLSGGADQALFSITAGGVLTFNTAPNFEVAGDAGANGVYDVQVTVTDNGAPNLSDVQDIAVTVTDVNDSPVITSDGGGATAAVNAAENQTAVTTVTATDVDMPAQTLTFSISGGADQLLFGITAGGVLTFNSAPDFEMAGDAGGNGVYDVQVTVTDNGAPNLSDVQDIAVTVTNVNEPPTAVDDSYAGLPVNVLLDAGAVTTMGVEVNNADGVLTSGTDDSDVEGGTLTVTQVQAMAVPGGGSASATTDGGGSVTMNSDGTFTYVSEVGETSGSDTFSYTVSDGGLTDSATVTITFTANTIWFIDATGAAVATGQSNDPFDDITSFNAATTGTGDLVFLHAGTYTDDGVDLLDSQQLIGAEDGLTDGNLTVAAGTAPTLAPGTDNGVNLAAGNTVRGLNIGNTPLGHAVSGGVVGNLTISNVEVSGSGGIIEVTTSGNLDNVTFAAQTSTSTEAASGDAAIDLTGISGTYNGGSPTISASDGAGISISASSANLNFVTATIDGPGGSGLDLPGANTGLVTFGSGSTIGGMTSPSGVGININGGGGGSAVSLTFSGNLTQASAGQAAVSVTNHSAGTITLQTGTLTATNGTGLQFSNADGSYNFNGATTLNGGDAGIDILAGSDVLAGSTGTFVFGTATTITNPSGDAFNLTNSNASVTFSGSIDDADDIAVNIDNHDAGNVTFQTGTIASDGAGIRVLNSDGGTVSFNGGMTLNTGTNNAVSLTTNPGSTINFGGTLDIDTTTGAGFNATNSGTVNVTGSASTVNGTRTAVNIADTTIGVSGMTFQSVAVDGGGTSNVAAIILDDTGTGAFTITGTGTTDGSGGTIQDVLEDAIRLFNTDGAVSLSNMIIQDIGDTGSAAPGHHGVDGQQVDGGLTLANVTIERVTDSAIHGEAPGGGSTTWDGLTLTDSTLANSNRFHLAGLADGGATDEAMVTIEGISGTVDILRNDFDDGPGFVNLFTAASGTVDITVQTNTFDDGRKDLASVPSVGSSGVRVNTNGTIDAQIHIGDPAEASNALGNIFTDPGTDASIFIGGFSAADSADVDLVISRNTVTVLDHTSPTGLCVTLGTCAFDFPNGGIGVESRGSGTFEAIVSQNTLTETQNSGGLSTGSLRVDVSGANTEVFVRNNTLRDAWDGTLFIRADDADGNGARGFIQVMSNVYNAGTGLIGEPGSGDDLDSFGLANSTAPFFPNRYQVRNGAVLDLTIDDDDMVLHETGFAPNNGLGSHDILINGDGVGGTVSTFNVLVRDSTGPYVTRGFRLRNDDHGADATDSALNLSTGVSGAAAATDISSAQAQTVLNGNGNTGTADVQFTGTNIVTSTPTLPTVFDSP